MAKDYKKMYVQLQNNYEALYEHMLNLDEDIHALSTELTYYAEYISWKNLNEEFMYFQKNAYEIQDENSPFPTLTL